MAITAVATGGIISGATGTLTPFYPSGLAVNDILIAVWSSNDNVSITPPSNTVNGWNKIVEINNGTGMRLTVAWNRWATGDVTAAWSKAGSTAWTGRITAFRGVKVAGNPYAVAPTTLNNASSTTITATGLTTTSANNLIFFAACARADQANTSAYSAWTSTGTGAMTEVIDNSTSTGSGASIGAAYGFKTTAGATGNATATYNTAALTTGALIALVPELNIYTYPTGKTSDEAFGQPSVSGAVTPWHRENDLEMGTDETVISAANSAGTDQDALNLFYSNTAPVFDNAQSAHGSFSMRTQHTGTSGSSMGGWTFTSEGKTTLYTRAYLRVSAYPTAATTTIIRFGTTGDATTGLSSILLTNTGMLNIGTTGSNLTTAIPLNTWVRVEVEITPTGYELRLYTTMDSNTITDSVTWSGSPATVGTIRFGVNATTAAGPLWWDDVKIMANDWIGPVSIPAQTMDVTGFDDNDVVGSPTATVVIPSQTMSPNAIGSTEAHGTTVVSAQVTLSPTALATAQAFGNPTLSGQTTMSPTAVSTALVFGTTSLSGVTTITATGVTTGLAFGTTVLSGQTTVSPSGFDDADVVGTPTLSSVVSLAPTEIGSALVFGNPTLANILGAVSNGIATGEAFGAPLLGTMLNSSPVGISTSLVFGTPSVLTSQLSSPIEIATAEAFGVPSLLSLLTVVTSGIATSQVFGATAINTILNAVPAAIGSNEAFGASSLSTFVVVSPTGFSDPSAFGIPAVGGSLTVTVNGIVTGLVFGNPSTLASVIISPVAIGSSEVVGNPTHVNIRYMTNVGIFSIENFGTSSALGLLSSSPVAITTGLAFGNPVIQVVLNAMPISITTAELFGIASLLGKTTLVPAGIASEETVGLPQKNVLGFFSGWGIPIGIGLVE